MTDLQKARSEFDPKLPKILKNQLTAKSQDVLELDQECAAELKEAFPHTYANPLLNFVSGESPSRPLKVGAVFSGGQAAGGHNVLSGLFDALKKFHPESQLYGFIGGPRGLFIDSYTEITSEILDPYRNQGGFDLIGSGRDKIEKPEQFEATAQVVKNLGLDGVVIIGGDDSNTNAAFLAEYFLQHNIDCQVVGVPKTIDGDLTNQFIEMSFGFDSACKTYSEIIGNIARDALSAGKYYFFIKLMGRSASHIALECALQTHANYTLIGEEVQKEEKTLQEIVNDIADLICERADKNKNYGVILIPEGIVEFIPEIKTLISELNHLLAEKSDQTPESIKEHFSSHSRECYQTLPLEIQAQLLKDRDPHGNVQVSKIESDRLLLQMVRTELKKRGQKYQGKFSAQPYFCGYEGRSGLPSNFDTQYCYALGYVAALLIEQKKTGYMACVTHLDQPVEEWGILGIPLVPLMCKEMRKGKMKIVIRKALVDLDGPVFAEFKRLRQDWRCQDAYVYPGPIQFFGDAILTDSVTETLRLKNRKASWV
ncbi:MAG: Pyrophosphate--fructose 6-phosphate 1-phosphotransferase [Chlamydiae bacterium]|nr:Pyrophosphate--fructose 6-phosphate 1-phosphotransferase [Chlamydiota bacterium]